MKHESPILAKTAFGALIASTGMNALITAVPSISRSVNLRPFNSSEHIRRILLEYGNLATERLSKCQFEHLGDM
jgi:hypothetical protein